MSFLTIKENDFFWFFSSERSFQSSTSIQISVSNDIDLCESVLFLYKTELFKISWKRQRRILKDGRSSVFWKKNKE